ncbi:MAG: hypothetical protein KUG77_14720, partial [Nannocystaceae bacterium]|nr:hypothetical protein [Nannocystaceae bacterium]
MLREVFGMHTCVSALMLGLALTGCGRTDLTPATGRDGTTAGPDPGTTTGFGTTTGGPSPSTSGLPTTFGTTTGITSSEGSTSSTGEGSDASSSSTGDPPDCDNGAWQGNTSVVTMAELESL